MMILLMGGGKTYDFLATQLLQEYPNDVVQISPKYAGPVFEDSYQRWYKLEDEVDEVTILLHDAPVLQNIVFNKVYLCIPEIEIEKTTLTTSHGLIRILKDHLCSYLYLIKQLIRYKTNLSAICEIDISLEVNDFEIMMFYSIIRPLISVSLQGTGTILDFISKQILDQKSLEEWYLTTWNKGLK